MRKIAREAVRRVARDSGPCDACGDLGDLRKLGLTLCHPCRNVLVTACLRKVRREPPTANSYPCEFCLGVHLSQSAWDVSTIPPEYLRRREQLHTALVAAGLIGPALNPTTED